ncbi:MAG: hypothetical protein RLP15_04570 [Cryomorphaceae bacterium]
MKTFLNYLLIICVIALSGCEASNSQNGENGKSSTRAETVKVESVVGLWKLYKTESGPDEDRKIETERDNVYLNLQASGSYELKDKKGKWVLADSKNDLEIGSLIVLIPASYGSEKAIAAEIVNESETEYLVLSHLTKDEDLFFVRQK